MATYGNLPTYGFGHNPVVTLGLGWPFADPSVTITAYPTLLTAGDVTIEYDLLDQTGDTCSIVPEYSPDNGSNWYPCTESSDPASDGTTGLTSSPTGVAHTFIWDSVADVLIYSAKCLVRITPWDLYEGTEGTTGIMSIRNPIPTNFVTRITPEVIFMMDPDEVMKYYTYLIETERVEWVGTIQDLLKFIDPDECPSQYLPYLAQLVGVRLYSEDAENLQRLQIKDAVRWYKTKGHADSFTTYFRSLGYDCEAKPIWVDLTDPLNPVCDDTDRTDILNTPPGFSAAPWYPHSRINLYLSPIHPDTSLDPAQIAEILLRIEEVRPIHILVLNIILVLTLIDIFELPDDTLGLVAGTSSTVIWDPSFAMCRNPCSGHPEVSPFAMWRSYDALPPVPPCLNHFNGYPTDPTVTPVLRDGLSGFDRSCIDGGLGRFDPLEYTISGFFAADDFGPPHRPDPTAAPLPAGVAPKGNARDGMIPARGTNVPGIPPLTPGGVTPSGTGIILGAWTHGDLAAQVMADRLDIIVS